MSKILNCLAPRVAVPVFPKLAKLRFITEDSVNRLARTVHERWLGFPRMSCNPVVDFLGVGVSVSEVTKQSCQDFAGSEGTAGDILIKVVIPNAFQFTKRGFDE